MAGHAKDPKRLWATFNGLLGRHGAGSHSKTPKFCAKDFAGYTARARSAPSAPTLPALPSEVSADCSSYGHVEGNLLCRAPFILHVVCSKVVQVRLPSVLSDPKLRGRFTPFPHSPLQPVSSRRCFPDSQKGSVVFSALKRDGLDLKDPSNFQPMSNVSFLSKMLLSPLFMLFCSAP